MARRAFKDPWAGKPVPLKRGFTREVKLSGETWVEDWRQCEWCELFVRSVIGVPTGKTSLCKPHLWVWLRLDIVRDTYNSGALPKKVYHHLFAELLAEARKIGDEHFAQR